MNNREHHQRLACLENYLAREFQSLHARVGRGFQDLRARISSKPGARKPSAPPAATDPFPKLESRLTEALTQSLENHYERVFTRHRQTWERAMASELPPQLSQLLRTARRTIRLLTALFILALLALGCLSWFTHRALLARTPTAFQIEMMRKGFEVHQQEKPD